MTMSDDFLSASPEGRIALIEARLNSALSPNPCMSATTAPSTPVTRVPRQAGTIR